MNCRQAQTHLFTGRDNKLGEVEHAALAAHVSACAACRQIQQDLDQAFAEWTSSTTAVRVPDANLEWHRLRRQMHVPAASPARRSLIGWVALPLAAAAAVAIGIYVSPLNNTPATPAASVAAASASITPAANGDAASTLVFVDDKSGWTFVWTADSGGNGQHI